MMMILPSSSDATALLTALKNMHARLLEHASLLWRPETTDAIRAAHEGVIGQILTMNLLRIGLSGATIVFASKTRALMRYSTSNYV